MQDNTKGSIYDFIFIGMGASSCLMLKSLFKRGLLYNKRVLVVEKDSKNVNDRTFCFWAQPDESIVTDLSDLITQSWGSVTHHAEGIISMLPYRYYYIKGIDLYNEAKSICEEVDATWKLDAVDEIGRDEKGSFVVISKECIYSAHVFDSRPPKYLPIKFPKVHLNQSFIGWFISHDGQHGNEDTLTLMDFSVPQLGNTQFMYILPFDQNTALVELTRFGDNQLTEEEAYPILEAYIQSRFGEFSILSTEEGSIPMTNAKPDVKDMEDVTLLGARGGMIKPSTGYAFKRMYTFAKQWKTESLTKSKDIGKERFEWYDGLLLYILSIWPYKGSQIFTQLFAKVPLARVILFLEEKTHWKQEVSIFSKLPVWLFIKTLVITQFHLFRPLLILLFIVVLNVNGPADGLQESIGWIVLLVGMILVGFPHGALDHVIEQMSESNTQLLKFISKYLILMAMMGLLWWWSSPLALLVFLLFSIWHFGQADGVYWEMSPIVSLIWGGSVLLFILGTHSQESSDILRTLGYLGTVPNIPIWYGLPWLGLAIWRRNLNWILTILWLALTTNLPLVMAFGFYFIGQHSTVGWLHLKRSFKVSHVQMWTKALPFQLGAWIFLAAFYFFNDQIAALSSVSPWSIFFIFISCVSWPHIMVMHRFYLKYTGNL